MNPENKVLKFAGLSLFLFGALSALGIWKQSCRKTKREEKLDKRLEDSFPASDATAKY
ncbi:MAG: hypothetical protein M9921_01025 [Fimbriimonadaceae bacterium]|nr:hypothetical protein [Fimbriimonadaceae bacterium]